MMGSGGTPSRKKNEYYSSGTINWLKTKELEDSNIYITEEKITESGLKNSSAKIFPVNTVTMAMYGATVGKLGILKVESATNQACCNMVVDDNKADHRFLFYSLLNHREQLVGLANGAAQQNLNKGVIGDFEINLFSLVEQNKIATILSNLDEKIEVNNKINKILEEMSAAIFKHWFVDFEFPNENGDPYRSSGGEMVESILGLIPKGWEVKQLSNICSVKDGTHASPKNVQEGYPLITSKHLMGTKLDFASAKLISLEDYEEVNKRSKVDRYDILISMIGTVGNLYLVQNESINFAIKNVGLFKTSETLDMYEYLYCYLKTPYITQYIKERMAGSTQQYISLGELRKIPIIVPSELILRKFKTTANSLFAKIYNNAVENEKISSVRDNILPKLMSGEIRVPIEE